MRTLHFLVPMFALGAPAIAQNVKPCWITDTTDDDIYRCVDLTPDDDFNDGLEIVKVYDSALGTVPLQLPTGIAAGVDGTMGISDGGEDSLFLLRDYNSDGDAQDPGEFWRYFDARAGGNASGILLPTALSLCHDASRRLWWTVNTTGTDGIFATGDVNGDQDANDAGESLMFWTPPAGAASNDYQPTSVYVEPALIVMPSGPQPPTLPPQGARAWYTDNGTTGVIMKGVYSVWDLDGNGNGNDANEWKPYFTPSTVNAPFYWSISRDANGWFYIADAGNEVVWKFRDNNNDRDAHDLNESFPIYPVGGASNIWDTYAANDGSVYLLESQAPDRLQRLFDGDANNVIVPGEIIEAYNETLSAVIFGNPRGIDGDPLPAAGTPYCSGDGSATACPCGNVGEPGKGCPNSLFPGGARLETTGAAVITNDTLSVVGRYMPNGSCVYFQGTSAVGGGLGAVFGDGLRCVSGSVRRFQIQTNADFRSAYPGPGNNPISVAGVVVAPATYNYQCWYRNGNPTFCTPDTFNLTNAVTVTWSM